MSAPNPSTPEATRHTPGPWTAEHDADGDFGIFWGNKHICTTVSDTTEDEANAHLIIAAPELGALLLESRESIGGDWHERRDAILKKAGLI
jgi:hypothetical protein